jgi:hypothetical protein
MISIANFASVFTNLPSDKELRKIPALTNFPIYKFQSDVDGFIAEISLQLPVTADIKTVDSITNLYEGQGEFLANITLDSDTKIVIRCFEARAPVTLQKWVKLFIKASQMTVLDKKNVGPTRTELLYKLKDGKIGLVTFQRKPGFIFMIAAEMKESISKFNFLKAYIPITTFLSTINYTEKSNLLFSSHSINGYTNATFLFDPENWKISYNTNNFNNEIYLYLVRTYKNKVVGAITINVIKPDKFVNIDTNAFLANALEEFKTAGYKNFESLGKRGQRNNFFAMKNSKIFLIEIYAFKTKNYIYVLSLVSDAARDVRSKLIVAQNERWFSLIYDSLKINK